ncbi:hypothetical protein [Dyella choica]|uniref:Uncharacterized protein n=1 Tax=Dyella choica TaxID=1927959 RepID=A0A432M793_9GAMM|nr:hypothetical protein [Dyella choica]RUL76809.1 hypothetical protein EKH80_08875 [Dyella choica]
MRQRKWMFGLLLVAAAAAHAQDMPNALRDWQGWVLHDNPQHGCPFLANSSPNAGSYQCVWPGRLDVQAGKDGGRFSLDVRMDAPAWVELPGDEQAWPQQVMANNKALPVLSRDGHPALWLEPGSYTVHGNLPWDSRPARLRVPSAIGLVSLDLDGHAVERIERNSDQLTLGEAAAAQRQADALSVRVYRHLADGMPAMLETQVQLNVTGSAREQVLGPALPKGFVATSLEGDLPVQLDGDGRLRLQLRPGQWTVTLAARGVDTLHAVNLGSPVEPWPKQEVWSYSDAPQLRNTRVDGHVTDAGQAGVPPEWRELPAFALDLGHGLTIEQGLRGGEGGASEQIRLQRHMWLDFNGRGLSISDHLTGKLQRTQRLDVVAPWLVQRATQGSAPLLITRSGDGHTGVELRDAQLDLRAGLRIDQRGGALPSTGWQMPVEDIDAVLHLPYGYRLLGASGVDRSPDSWIGQWTLLDLFIVALIALLAGRLLGWRWAVLGGLFLILSQHEGGAPRWTLGLALAFALLMRALPAGKLRQFAHVFASAALALALLWTLPFAKTQLEFALHPQLEGSSGNAALGAVADLARAQKQEVKSMPAPPPPPPPAPVQEEVVQAEAPPPVSEAEPTASNAPSSAVQHSLVLNSVTVTANKMLDNPVATEMDSRSIIQAGAGEPSWNVDNNYHLGWSGPVTPAQTMRLIIAPSWLVRLLRVAMLALLVSLLGRMARDLIKPAGTVGNWRPWRAAAASLLLGCLPHFGHTQATPSPNVLSELRSHLLEPPKCAPSCAGIAAATLHVANDQVTLDLETHAGAAIAVPMPRTKAELQLVDAKVDGRTDATLAKRDDLPYVRLEPGVHHLVLSYRIQPVDSVTLNFALRPQWITFIGDGWTLDGTHGNRLLGDSITLNRVRTSADGKQAALPQQAFPPYVSVARDIVLGVDWTVVNTVERVAPSEGGFTVDIPLLAGEHPLGDGERVHDGRISVTFTAGQAEASWSSRLDHSDSVLLKAPSLDQRAETWQLHAAPIWHVEAKGLPVNDNSNGLSFEPLPNETLQLSIHRPAAVDGDSLAFDGVSASSNVGDRATETTLALTARSTRGGEHEITLPAGTELLEARRDDDSLSLAMRDGKLSLPLLPGKHGYSLRLRVPRGIGASAVSSAIGLGAPSANIALSLQLPQDRWVLWTWGPSSGPAVLYWSQLIVLLLAAWLLARYAPTPLRFHHWLLLGLGFSAFAWTAFAFVVLWLILLGLRARHDAALTGFATVKFNLLQAALAVVTLLALITLISAVPKGLLGLPDMHVAGNDSTAWSLNWFADQSGNALPNAGVISVSLWFYKIAMLAWAIWLANALIGWLRWGFEAWTKGGYWRKREAKRPVPPLPAEPAAGAPREG